VTNATKADLVINFADPAATLADYNDFTILSSDYIESLLKTATSSMINDLTATEASQIVQHLSQFDDISDSYLSSMLQKLRSDTFPALGSSKLTSIINSISDAELRSLPLSVKNSLIFSLSVEDFLSVTLPDLYTNQERLINMANLPLDNINELSQVLLMNAMNALSGTEISTLGSTKIAELINKVNLDFSLVPDAKVVDILSEIPLDTFKQIDQAVLEKIVESISTQTFNSLSLSIQQAINGAVDSTAPVYQSAATNGTGTKIILTYDSALYATTAGTSDFVVNVNGTPVTVQGNRIKNILTRSQ
jgi:hypothetical protein